MTQSFDPSTRTRVIPLGGVGEFGANMTAYVHDGHVLIVDCGMSFPEAFRLGIDAVIPDAFAWLESMGGPRAYLITHAHEDHFGGLPHYLRRFNAPVFASPWTASMIRQKLDRHDMADKASIHDVTPGMTTTSGPFSIEWLPINHSIPMACSLLIRVADNTVFHSGDFKLGDDGGWRALLTARLRSAGVEGVDYALLDSTNAETPGKSPPEDDVAEALGDVFGKARGAIFITTFSSHFERIQTIAAVAHQHGRRLWIIGQGMENTIAIARSVDAWNPPEGSTVGEHEAPWLPRDQLVIILTGSQGEPRSALTRVINGDDRRVAIQSGDTVVFSARLIPGNEKAVLELYNKALRQGAHIVTTKSHPGIHSSGHGHQDEIRELVRLASPRYVIPMHGTFTQQNANRDLAQLEGAACPIIPCNGDVIELGVDGPAVVERLNIEKQFVDAESLMPMPWETLRERLRVGEQGLAVVAGLFDLSTRQWLVPMSLLTRGLAALPWTNMEKAREAVRHAVEERLASDLAVGENDLGALMENVRIAIRRELANFVGKKPVVIPSLILTHNDEDAH